MECSVEIIHFPMKPLSEKQSIINIVGIANVQQDYLRYTVSSTHPECVIVQPVTGMLSPWADTDIEVRWDSGVIPVDNFQNLDPPVQPRLRIVPVTSAGELASVELKIVFSMPREDRLRYYFYLGKLLHANPSPLHSTTSPTVGISDVLRYEQTRSRKRIRSLLTDDQSSEQSSTSTPQSEGQLENYDPPRGSSVAMQSSDRHLCSTCCLS